MAGPLAPTLVQDRFLPLQEELLGVLHGLPAGAWDLPTPSRRWLLEEGPAEAAAGAQAPKARISLDLESAWRIFTGSLPRDEAKRRATASGDPALFDPFFGVVAIMK